MRNFGYVFAWVYTSTVTYFFRPRFLPATSIGLIAWRKGTITTILQIITARSSAVVNVWTSLFVHFIWIETNSLKKLTLNWIVLRHFFLRNGSSRASASNMDTIIHWRRLSRIRGARAENFCSPGKRFVCPSSFKRNAFCVHSCRCFIFHHPGKHFVARLLLNIIIRPISPDAKLCWSTTLIDPLATTAEHRQLPSSTFKAAQIVIYYTFTVMAFVNTIKMNVYDCVKSFRAAPPS